RIRGSVSAGNGHRQRTRMAKLSAIFRDAEIVDRYGRDRTAVDLWRRAHEHARNTARGLLLLAARILPAESRTRAWWADTAAWPDHPGNPCVERTDTVTDRGCAVAGGGFHGRARHIPRNRRRTARAGPDQRGTGSRWRAAILVPL